MISNGVLLIAEKPDRHCVVKGLSNLVMLRRPTRQGRFYHRNDLPSKPLSPNPDLILSHWCYVWLIYMENAAGRGTQCAPDAPAKPMSITIFMVVAVYPYAANGQSYRTSMIGPLLTASLPASQSTESTTTETMNRPIAAGPLGLYNGITKQTSNGLSLTACDLRNEAGPGASELQTLLYCTDLNAGLLRKHLPCQTNRGRECNRCFCQVLPQLKLLLHQTQALTTPVNLVGGVLVANHTYMPGGVLNHPVEGIVSEINWRTA